MYNSYWRLTTHSDVLRARLCIALSTAVLQHHLDALDVRDALLLDDNEKRQERSTLDTIVMMNSLNLVQRL